MRVVGSIATMIRVRFRFKAVKDDPDDDVILRTAFGCGSDYVVSEDRHLLSLGKFRGIKIVTVNHMLKLLKDLRTGC